MKQFISDRKKMFYWQTDRPFTEPEVNEIFLKRHQNINLDEIKSALEYGMIQYGYSPADAKVVKIEDPIKAGSVNSSCPALLADGSKVIIRVHPAGIPNSYFFVEKLATEAASAHGVPTYKTFYVDDSKSRYPFDYMIMKTAPGKTLHLSGPYGDGQIMEFERENGRYAAMINSIRTEGYGFFDNSAAKEKNRLTGLHKKWIDHIFAALDENLEYLRAQKVIDSTQIGLVEKIFNEKQKLVSHADPMLIHNDIAPWNELVQDNHVSAIIDWDECFSGDPVCEIAAYSLFFEGPRLDSFIEGYKSVKKLPDDYTERYHYYRLRYTLSKMTLRAKKYVFYKGPFIKDKLDYSKKILQDELNFYK